MISPLTPALFLAEALFGILYNTAVSHLQNWKLWHVSTSVVVGVAGTLAIATAFLWHVEMPFWLASLLFFGCFASSGAPMVIGSWARTIKARQENESHKRREWPTAAKQARDNALQDLSALAHDIANASERGEISLKHLPGYVNRIYQVIGTLKSV
jgi:hypothetical protein